jgi:threonylcarbamoyladenosine tRNA methylthiotransferase MtaB
MGGGRLKIEKVAIATLGCRVNQYESEAIAHDFEVAGYEIVRNKKDADIIVVNTCCVTKNSESKSRRIIRHLHTENEKALIVVTGCYGQRAGHELLAIPGVSLVTGNGEKENLAQLVKNLSLQQIPSLDVSNIMTHRSFPHAHVKEKETNRVRDYLKIQDGCEQFCTYCIIPYVRGPVVSRPYEDIIAEAKCCEERGFKELVLTGIHTGYYGKDLSDDLNLVTVLKGLLKETNISRFRVSSIEPKEVSDELIELIGKEERLCNHFHIPLQSGDNEILAKMGRPYTREEYIALTKRIYKKIPDAAISADIIVGFPGESDGAFDNTIDLLANAEFAFIHSFPYSPREGTKAALFPHRVPGKLKEERQKTLLTLGEFYKYRFAERHIWQSLDVLVESKDANGFYQGHTDNFLMVRFPAESKNLIGKIVKVKALKNDEGALIGEEIKE